MRIIEIPDDGIVRIPMNEGEAVIGEYRVNLSFLPTIDAAPVVRCNDCKHAMPITNPLIVKAIDGKAMACSIWRGTLCCGLSVVTPNEYCSDGAKMDGDQHDSC